MKITYKWANDSGRGDVEKGKVERNFVGKLFPIFIDEVLVMNSSSLRNPEGLLRWHFSLGLQNELIHLDTIEGFFCN